MTETICDDAENVAGAGTDVRQCSDALGPRKNLQRYSHNTKMPGTLVEDHARNVSVMHNMTGEGILKLCKASRETRSTVEGGAGSAPATIYS
jgi:hypothetical protein